ncbi:MAG: chorismate-binding protein [Cytophagaceae bacterium]|nr:chorismate-binding protein [Cytophagaceae bacterium]MDW8456785.1 chorismate-binding protein [Cytophagaceae bacterium]
MKNTTNENTSVLSVQSDTRDIVYPALMAASKEAGASYAVWKLPQRNSLSFLADLSVEPILATINPDEPTSGFVISPFENFENKASWFLNADILYSDEKHYLRIAPSTDEFQRNRKELFINAFEHNKEIIKDASFQSLCYLKNITSTFALSRQEYENLVKKCTQEIVNGVFQKAVLARRKILAFDTSKKVWPVFKAICNKYSDACVCIFSTPHTGTWVTASPELLLSVENGLFKTVALAGTQKLHTNEPLQKVVWTQKEIEEQALVSRYIINCFKSIRLREFEEYGPRTIQAGTLAHLKTEFTVDLQVIEYNNLAATMLKLLHPTSAVCGMPKIKALEFINNHERIDRECFAGYIGPVNINDSTHLYVNIRTVQIADESVVLYAGAGITQDSVPEKEWEETELKMQVMANFFE